MLGSSKLLCWKGGYPNLQGEEKNRFVLMHEVANRWRIVSKTLFHLFQMPGVARGISRKDFHFSVYGHFT